MPPYELSTLAVNESANNCSPNTWAFFANIFYIIHVKSWTILYQIQFNFRFLYFLCHNCALHNTMHTLFECTAVEFNYHQTSSISCTLVGNELLITHHLSTLPQLHLCSRLNSWLQWIAHRQPQDEMTNIKVLGFGAFYIWGLMVYHMLIQIILCKCHTTQG